LVGFTEGALFFESDTLNPNPTCNTCTGTFFVKYNSNGNFIWAKSLQSVGFYADNEATSIVTDPSGGVYVSGGFVDTLILGKDKLINPRGAAYLTKYDSNGNEVWAKMPGGSGTGGGGCISADTKGGIYVSGDFVDTIIIGTYTLTAPGYAVFLAKYNENGVVKWVKQSKITSSNCEGVGNALINDNKSNTYITGYFKDTLIFGSTVLSCNDYEVFLVKYDSTGNVLWAKQGSGYGSAMGNAVTVDNFGNAYITGEFYDTVRFGKYTLTDTKKINKDFFIVKYDPKGNVIWAKSASIMDTNGWIGYAISADMNGHLYFTAGPDGYYYTHIYLYYGTDTLTSNNIVDPSIILELDTAGNYMCGTILASGGDDENGVVSDPTGKYVFMGGDLVGVRPYLFGKDTLNGNSEYPFVARWESCSTISAGTPTIFPERQNIILFPNPNNGVFTIQANGYQPIANSQIEIYNMLGEKVYSHYQITNSSNYQIDLSSQPSGIYLYRVLKESGEAIGQGKVIIQK